ncbi:sigma-70 family RNA polymerase sigma factor [Oceanicella sp. SM1341]|uniref:sigma-70 family RNA polymerase sigma factor n=1 Tax=Oceanicella sp. SM1341 TaxID=1548889 RepID=UPI001E31AF34|nr:sigma-70 family RNA polymerase sigma factor [Oceanicella sp. SM1341]
MSDLRSEQEQARALREAEAARLRAEHRALVARIAGARDRAAFAALFAHFGPRIKALMIRAGADHAQADDLAQDVMLTVWRKIDLYHPARGSVQGWIFTIARNARIDRLRRGSARPYEDVEALELASDTPDGEEGVLSSEICEHVGAAIATLPDDQRTIIEYAYAHDLSQTQIARRLELPLGTVKSRMRLAYGRLKDRLEELR